MIGALVTQWRGGPTHSDQFEHDRLERLGRLQTESVCNPPVQSNVLFFPRSMSPLASIGPRKAWYESQSSNSSGLTL